MFAKNIGSKPKRAMTSIVGILSAMAFFVSWSHADEEIPDPREIPAAIAENGWKPEYGSPVPYAASRDSIGPTPIKASDPVSADFARLRAFVLGAYGSPDSSPAELRWVTYAESLGAYHRDVPLWESVRNGKAYVSPEQAGIGYYWTHFELDLPPLVNANDMELLARVKNSPFEWGLSAYDTVMQIDTGNAFGSRYTWANWTGEQWWLPWTSYGAGGNVAGGIPELIRDFSDWHVIGVRTKNGQFSITYDGETVKTIPYWAMPNTITKLHFVFKGSGSMDWVKLYQKDRLVLHESFNSDGVTTARLDVNGSGGGKPQDAIPDPADACPPGHVCHSADSESVEIAGGTYKSDQGDPVRLSNGEMTYSNVFLTNPGALANEFSLDYASRFAYDGPVGYGWNHSLNKFLRENADGSVLFSDGKSGVRTFSKNADGSFARDGAIKAALVRNAESYSLRFDDGIEYTFGSDLRVAIERDRNGNERSYSYDAEGKLVSVRDPEGRTLAFEHSPEGRVTRVVTNDGRSVRISYSPAGDVEAVTVAHPGIAGNSEKTVSFGYDGTHRLARLTDSKGQTYVENAYENGRVVSQKYGDGILRYSYETNAEGKVTRNTVTDRRGTVTAYEFDPNGNVLSSSTQTPQGPAIHRFSYDSEGRAVLAVRPGGSGIAYRYDSLGNLVEKREKADVSLPDDDFSDLVSRWAYDPATKLLLRSVDPEGRETRYGYDAKGNLTTVENPAREGIATVRVERDPAGRITKITDPEGRETAYAYSWNLPVSVRRGTGGESVTETFAYDAFGNPVSVTDAEGNVRKFERDAFGMVLSEISPEGPIRKYAYDANGNRTKTEIPLGEGRTLVEEASFGLLDEILSIKSGIPEEGFRTVSKRYDANGNVTAMGNPDGSEIRYSYDAIGRITEKRPIGSDGSDALGNVTRFSYDADGNLVSSTDALGNVTRFSYDAFGRVASLTDALGNSIRYAYRKDGKVAAYRVFGADGSELLTKYFEYDPAWNRIAETATDAKTRKSVTVSATYDRTGRAISRTDAAGNVTKFSYDSLGRLSNTTDPLGNVATFSYDGRGLVIEKRIAGADGTSTGIRYAYDKDGRKISETDALGRVIRFEYDALGRVASKTDPSGTVTAFGYDAFGGLVSETVSGSGITAVTRYAYDAMGRRVSLTDANGNVTKYSYDPLGRLASLTYADGTSDTYSYDAAGNLLSKTDGNGTSVRYSYDPLGRLAERSEIPGAGVVPTGRETYSYDPLGRLVSAKEEAGKSLSFAYDAFGSLLSEASDGETVSYSYDPLGNATEISYPSGRKVSRSYDALSRLTGISSGGSAIAGYALGSLATASVTLGNGAKTEYSYDPLLRLGSLSHSLPGKESGKGKGASPEILSDSRFSYSPAGGLLADGRDSFGYDALSRLVSASYAPFAGRAAVSETFSYDPVGNRTSLVTAETEEAGKEAKVSTGIASYSSNALNQYVSVAESGGGYRDGKEGRDGDGRRKGKTDVRDFAYDRNGNMVSDGKFRYSYDSRNRLREARKPDGTLVAKYAYDPLGRRVSKETGNSRTGYSYAGHDAAEERDYGKASDGSWAVAEVRENVFWNGMDDLVAVFRTRYADGKAGIPETLYFLKDRLGSAAAVTDSKGKIVEEYRHSAFGTAFVRAGKSENWKEVGGSGDGDGFRKPATLRLFAGREYDPETGLYHYRARTYSPELGRFLQRDPVGTADQVNLYAYVANDPLGWTDPMGREKTLIIGFLGRRWDEYIWEVQRKDGFYGIWHSWISNVLDSLNNSSHAGIFDTKLYDSDLDWYGVESAWNFIRKNHASYDRIILLWHSLWGDNVMSLGEKLNKHSIEVDLSITIDIKSPLYEHDTVYSNIWTAINFYQDNDIFPFRWEDIEAADGNTVSNVINILFSDNSPEVIHTNIDNLLEDYLYRFITNF